MDLRAEGSVMPDDNDDHRTRLLRTLALGVLGVGALGVAVVAALRPVGSADDEGAALDMGPTTVLDPRLLGAVERLARDRAPGAEPDGPARFGALEKGGATRLRERVGGGRCYAWVGRSRAETDLDLFLRRDGEVVAQHERPDNAPVVRHCAAEAETLELEVLMYDGQGPWVVERRAYPASPGADQVELLHDMYARRVAKGTEPLWELRRITLREKQKAPVKLDLDPAFCYVALAVSDPGTDVDLFLHDPEDRQVEADESPDNWPVIRHCPHDPGTYKLRLVMYEGESRVAFQLFRDKRTR